MSIVSPLKYATYDAYKLARNNENKSNNNSSSSNNNSSLVVPMNYNSYEEYKAARDGVDVPEKELTDRGTLDKIFGVITNNSIVQGLYNVTDNDENTTFIGGVKEGFKYMNPMTNDVTNRKTFSDVLKNVGWEDKDPDHISLSDVGRGITGFVGDVLLDPLTYVNPFSSLTKVVKGSGATIDVAKALSDVNIADDIAKEVGRVTGAVTAENVKRIRGLDFKTAKDIVTGKTRADGFNMYAHATDEEIDAAAKHLMESFNSKIMKLAEGGQDFEFGLRNVPFMNKIKVGDSTAADVFTKTLAKSDTLRHLGDKTIAPYYNELAKKLRTSRLGKCFNTYYDIMLKAESGDKIAAATMFHAKNLLTAFSKLDVDLDDIAKAGKIEEYFNNLSFDDQIEFLRSIENGEFESILRAKQYIDGYRFASSKTSSELSFDYERFDSAMDAFSSAEKANAAYDAAFDALQNFKNSSKYNELIERFSELRNAGYVEVMPIPATYDDYASFENAFNAWKEEYKHRFGKQDYDAKKIWDDFNKYDFKAQSSMRQELMTIEELDNIYSGKIDSVPLTTKFLHTKNDFISYESGKNNYAFSKGSKGNSDSIVFDDSIFSPNNYGRLKNDNFDATQYAKTLLENPRLLSRLDELGSSNVIYNADDKVSASCAAVLQKVKYLYDNYFVDAYDAIKFLDKSDASYYSSRQQVLNSLREFYYHNVPDALASAFVDAPKTKATFAFNMFKYLRSVDNKYALTTLSEYKEIYKQMRSKMQVPHGVSMSEKHFSSAVVAIHEYGHLLYQSLVKDGFASDFEKEFDKLKNKKYFISEYGSKNAKEFFSEGFADLLLGAPTSVSQIVKKYLSKCGIDVSELEDFKFMHEDKEFTELRSKFNEAVDIRFHKRLDFRGTKLEKEFGLDNLAHIKKESEQAYDKLMSDFEVSYIDNLKRYNDAINKWGKDGIETADVFIKRMKEIAEDEYKRGLLSDEQFKAVDGTYITHFATQAFDEIKKKLGDDEGVWNPDILGLLKSYDKTRELLKDTGKVDNDGHKIYEIFRKNQMGGFTKAKDLFVDVDDNVLLKTKIGDQEFYQFGVDATVNGENIFKTSLSEIYLARALGSNRLVYGTDVQNFISKNIFETCETFDELKEGNSFVVTYNDIQKAIMGKAYNADVEQEFIQLGDKNFAITYSQNNPIQNINFTQAQYLKNLLGIEMMQAPTNLANLFNELSVLQKQELTSDFLNAYDSFINIWKMQNTVVTPGFHVQNGVSNAFQSFLGIGSRAFDAKRIKIANTILNNHDKKQTIKLGNKIYSYDQLYHLASKLGVIDEMFVKFEFQRGYDEGLFKKWLPPEFDITNSKHFVLNKLGTKIGTQIEGTQRLNLFMCALEDGHTPEEALDVVNKFMFDYGELTEFEQNTMKRIIPFYTFMRKNFPMELEQMIEQPQVFASLQKGFTEFEQLGGDYKTENERNEWRQEHIQIPNTGYGVSDQLPYSQIERILNARKLAGQITPAIKAPIEGITGQYLYTGIDIDSPKEYLANQFSYTKYNNMVEKKEGEAKRNYILGQMLGFPIGKV